MKGNPAATCPKCGGGADGLTAAPTNVTAHPKEGDFALCAYCGAVNMIAADLSLRPATSAELRQLRGMLEALELEHTLRQMGVL